MASLADQYTADRKAIRAGEAQECGGRCPCHQPLVCTRAAHPHAPGESSPHLTVAAVSDDPLDKPQIVQWQCHEEHAA